MSCLPKPLDICLACEWSTHVCSLVLRSGSARSAGSPALARSLSAFPGLATQPPVRSLPVHCCVTAHILLRSPTADAVIPLASLPPLPPPAFSHSSPLARTAVARTGVSLGLAPTGPTYSAHGLPQ